MSGVNRQQTLMSGTQWGETIVLIRTTRGNGKRKILWC